jgi:polysaccharide export outer membrane protein
MKRTMTRVTRFVLVQLMLIATCSLFGFQDSGPNTSTSMEDIAASYRLGPEDSLNIWALGVEEIPNRPITVDPQGYLDLPLIGRTKVVGHTLQQTRDELQRLYAPFVREPQVTVSLVEMRSQPVSVVGSVNTPGVLQLKGRKTLVEVISMAGGLKQDSGHAIKVTRKHEWGKFNLPSQTVQVHDGYSVAEINAEGLIKGMAPDHNISILPYDVISVPRAELVYVIGEVKKPGGFVLGEKRTSSVLQALSLAEGLAPAAAPSNARILRRQGSTGDRTEVPVNVRKILNGDERDFQLEAEDVLFVPSSTTRKVSLRALETAISLGTGILIWRR